MKKPCLFLLITLCCLSSAFAQPTVTFEAPQTNGSTTQLRAPNGLASSAYMQGCSLIQQSELTYIPSGSSITVFGFTLQNSSSISTPVTGNFTLYLQNTTDASYLKGTTWSSIIAPMTQVYASVLTIPMSSTSTSVTISLTTPFQYTGGALYLGYDWFCGGPYSTTNPATFWAESAALTTGCASGVSATGPPVLSTTNFRPTFLLGFANSYTNEMQVLGIEAPGRVPAALNTPHNIRALVRNNSNAPLSNVNVSVSVTGANVFNNFQTIPTLAAGQSTYVTFAGFNPQTAGSQTVNVFVGNDQFNSNNSLSWIENVTCNIWGLNPSVGQFTYNSVGFAAASGVIATTYSNPVTSTLTGMRGAVSSNTPSIGNNVYGVLLSSTGVILATTNTVNITAAMLNTVLSFSFATPVPLTANTSYYLGFAQTTPGNAIAYYPAGTIYQPYIQPNLYYIFSLTGGAPTALTQNFGFFGLEAVFAHTVTVSVPSQTITCGNSATLTGLSTTNYSWSTGATTNSIVVNTVTVPAVYSVTATNNLGCTASTSASLTVAPIPVAASISPTIVCLGNSVTLTATGANSFTWNTPSGQSNQPILVDAPPSTTSYTLSGSNPATGCSAGTIVTIVVNPLPPVNILYTASTLCLGNGVQLNASGASTYTWSTGSSANSISVAPQTSTTYVLAGTSAVGCVNAASVNLTVNSFTPQIVGPAIICDGETASLTATGATTLQWSTGSVFSGITVTPAVTTSYSVTGKSQANGCQGSASFTVSVNPTPTIVAAATRTSICRNEKTVLTASGAVTYSWSNGDATASTTINPTSTLPLSMVVTGTNASGCSASQTVSIKVSSCNGLDEEQSAGSWHVYPNPTNGILNFSLEAGSTGTLKLFNITGQELGSWEVETNGQINLAGFGTGIYLLQHTSKSGETSSVRVVYE